MSLPAHRLTPDTVNAGGFGGFSPRTLASTERGQSATREARRSLSTRRACGTRDVDRLATSERSERVARGGFTFSEHANRPSGERRL
jgi:hypothetical protein